MACMIAGCGKACLQRVYRRRTARTHLSLLLAAGYGNLQRLLLHHGRRAQHRVQLRGLLAYLVHTGDK